MGHWWFLGILSFSFLLCNFRRSGLFNSFYSFRNLFHKCNFEHIFHVIYKMDRHIVLDVLWNILKIRLVIKRKHSHFDPFSMDSEQFLFNTSDWKNLSLQRDLATHDHLF